MQEIFETFKPKNSTVKKFISYYYLDIKENNKVNTFTSFPHYNNSISIYKSHLRSKKNEMVFNENLKPFQIFTPIRENTLKVTQLGKVHRIVIVFHPLGINHFFTGIDFSSLLYNHNFFSEKELSLLFSTNSIQKSTQYLDAFLEKRLKIFTNEILQKSIVSIFETTQDFSVENLSIKLNISRQHLNRIFKNHMGVSVKVFHKIVKFRKTLNKKLQSNSNLTEIAYEFDYNDQSHLIKTYKSLTKNTPKSFFSKGTSIGNEDIFWHFYH